MPLRPTYTLEQGMALFYQEGLAQVRRQQRRQGNPGSIAEHPRSTSPWNAGPAPWPTARNHAAEAWILARAEVALREEVWQRREGCRDRWGFMTQPRMCEESEHEMPGSTRSVVENLLGPLGEEEEAWWRLGAVVSEAQYGPIQPPEPQQPEERSNQVAQPQAHCPMAITSMQPQQQVQTRCPARQMGDLIVFGPLTWRQQLASSWARLLEMETLRNTHTRMDSPRYPAHLSQQSCRYSDTFHRFNTVPCLAGRGKMLFEHLRLHGPEALEVDSMEDIEKEYRERHVSERRCKGWEVRMDPPGGCPRGMGYWVRDPDAFCCSRCT